MKKILFLLISLIFSSCEKEEVNTSNNNSNSYTGNSGSIYGEWKVTSDVLVESNGDVDSVIFLPNEYCHITFLDEHAAGDSYFKFIVENGYYTNLMEWREDIDTNGRCYINPNNDLVVEMGCGYPIGLEDAYHVITLFTNNKLEFFAAGFGYDNEGIRSYKLERP